MDGKCPKKYSSRKELKALAVTFAECNKLSPEIVAKFLLEADRLKSCGKLSDDKVLVNAYQNVLKLDRSEEQIL